MATFILGKWTFPSKKACLERVRQCLYENPIDVLLEGEDADLMLAVLLNHPRAGEKVGPGIRGIMPCLDIFEHPTFRAVRTDVSTVAFSFLKCITTPKAENDHQRKVVSAFRREVRDQTQKAKSEAVAAGYVCPISGQQMTHENADVHHSGSEMTPLAEAFLELRGLSFSDVEVLSGDVGGDMALVDRDLALAWQEYHREEAVLQVVHRDAHRAIDGAKIRPLNETYLRGSAKLLESLSPPETSSLPEALLKDLFGDDE